MNHGDRENVNDEETLAVLEEIRGALENIPSDRNELVYQTFAYHDLMYAEGWREEVLKRRINEAIRYGEGPLIVFNMGEEANTALTAGDRAIGDAKITKLALVNAREDYRADKKRWAVMEMDDGTVFVTQTDAEIIPFTHELLEEHIKYGKDSPSIQPLLEIMRDQYGVQDSEMPAVLEDLKETLLNGADNMQDIAQNLLEAAIKKDAVKLTAESLPNIMNALIKIVQQYDHSEYSSWIKFIGDHYSLPKEPDGPLVISPIVVGIIKKNIKICEYLYRSLKYRKLTEQVTERISSGK